MALGNVVFDQLLDQNASAGYTWNDGVFIALLLDTGLTGIDPGATSITAILGAATEVASSNYARQPVTGTSHTLDGGGHREQFFADPLEFGSLEAGFSFDTLLIAFLGDTDADSWPALAYDVSDSGSTRSTDGNPVNCNPDGSGYFVTAQA